MCNFYEGVVVPIPTLPDFPVMTTFVVSVGVVPVSPTALWISNLLLSSVLEKSGIILN
jgi:hypothetical protein|nr:MAG TPA: hypothetical protein [Bacteriophage sp.]